jgi:phosphonate transport system substrate-binding protein
MNKFSLCIATIFCFSPGQLLALDLSLSIQPILPGDQLVRAYQPLADYLSAKTGHNISIHAHQNFLTYWANLRRSRGMDLVMDAAHFTDYRVQKKGYTVLARLPDTVSFSVVTHEDNLIFDTDELVLKKVATMVSPSVGAIRLHSLFKDPMRQPKIIYASNSNDAARRVSNGEAFAAIIPTALVSSYEGLNTVMTTESLPHMGFSASPRVPLEIAAAIKQALVTATESAEGRLMLEKINFPFFENADATTYKGYAALLEDVLGY